MSKIFSILLLSTAFYLNALDPFPLENGDAVFIETETSFANSERETMLIRVFYDTTSKSPFIEMLTYQDPMLIADLTLFAPPSDLTPEETLDLVKKIAKSYNITEVYSKYFNQKIPYIKGTPTISLSLLSSFLYGEGFFQRTGAIPINREIIQIANDFLHKKFVIQNLIEDLYFIGYGNPNAVYNAGKIMEATQSFNLKSSDLVSTLISELNLSPQMDKTTSKNSPLEKWREISNFLMESSTDDNMILFCCYVVKHPKLYPEIIRKLAGNFIKTSLSLYYASTYVGTSFSVAMLQKHFSLARQYSLTTDDLPKLAEWIEEDSNFDIPGTAYLKWKVSFSILRTHQTVKFIIDDL